MTASEQLCGCLSDRPSVLDQRVGSIPATTGNITNLTVLPTDALPRYRQLAAVPRCIAEAILHMESMHKLAVGRSYHIVKI